MNTSVPSHVTYIRVLSNLVSLLDDTIMESASMLVLKSSRVNLLCDNSISDLKQNDISCIVLFITWNLCNTYKANDSR